MTERKRSRRQELLEFTDRGRLRDRVQSAGLSSAATDLLIDIVLRYCEPRIKRKPRQIK